MNNDLLKNSAIAFKKLLDKEYFIEIGRKGKSSTFKIIFEEDDFKHLSGINKLTDLPTIYKMPSNLLFKNAVSENITDKDLIPSTKFNSIKERLENLKNLEYYLNKNMAVFKWDKSKAKSSKITADFMLEEKSDNKKKAYFFLKEKNNFFGTEKTLKITEIKKENGVSFFLSSQDYPRGQVKFTLLKNEKIHKSTKIKELLFDFNANKKKL